MADQADNSVPRHIGYVVDGNRRWAKSHGIPAYEGHLAGYNALKEVLIATFDAGVEYASAYTFSTENWKRSEDEVTRLIGLTMRLLTADLPEFHSHNVQMKIIGSRDNLSKRIVKAIENAEQVTAENTGGVLAVCFNYGGQIEITDAFKSILNNGYTVEDITADLISDNLYAPQIPPADVIVRTGGEQRLSNFMLWRAAYSEFIFIDKMWPDMTKDDVTAIMDEYSRRNRRFGG